MRARKRGQTGADTQAQAAPTRWLDREEPSADHVFTDDLPYPAGSQRLIRIDDPYNGDEVLEAADKLLALSIDLLPKAVRYNRSVAGSRDGSLTTAAVHEARRKEWEDYLREYYEEHPLTRHSYYRTEAARLLRDPRVTWKKKGSSKDLPCPAPKREYLRKTILPPLLRGLFPRLYS